MNCAPPNLSDAELVELFGTGARIPGALRGRAADAVRTFSRREFAGRDFPGTTPGTQPAGPTPPAEREFGVLILSRQLDEAIVLDFSRASDREIELLRSGNAVIECSVTEMRRGQVRIGVQAPRTIEVHRREVWDADRRREAHADGPACGRCGKPLLGGESRLLVDGKPVHYECAALTAPGGCADVAGAG